MINLRCRNWTTTEATATCLPATSQYRHPHERMGRSWRATFEIDAPCSEPQSQKDGNQAPKTLTSPVLTLWHPHPAQFPPSRKIFGQNRNRGAHISALGSKSRPGTGDLDDTPPALHPPFIGASEGRWCALDAAPWTRQLLAGVRSYLFDIVSVVVRWRRIGKLAPPMSGSVRAA